MYGTLRALVYGVFIGGAAGLAIVALRRSTKGYFAYGPWLAAGALVVLLERA
jgi:hypothetical protein